MNSIKYFTIVGDFITLGQFLTEESVVLSGGQAKFYLQDNPVTLNGALENRRGKKIRVGDHLLVTGQEYEFRREE